MKRFPFLFVAAMFVAAVSTPAQAPGDLRGERSARGGIVSSHRAGNEAGSARVASRHVSRQATRHQVTQRAASQHVSRQVSQRGGKRHAAGRHAAGRHEFGRHVGQQTFRRGARYGHGAIGTDPLCTPRGCEPIRRPVRQHGYWKTVCEPVLVRAGYWDRQYVPAVYGWRYDSCGRRYWGVIESACYKKVWIEPCYEDRHRRVWVRY